VVPVVPIGRVSDRLPVVTPLRPGLDAGQHRPDAGAAFSPPTRKRQGGGPLSINSPGGSPVLAIESDLLRHSSTRSGTANCRCWPFVEDRRGPPSGGYMIACAGDRDLLDPASSWD